MNILKALAIIQKYGRYVLYLPIVVDLWELIKAAQAYFGADSGTGAQKKAAVLEEFADVVNGAVGGKLIDADDAEKILRLAPDAIDAIVALAKRLFGKVPAELPNEPAEPTEPGNPNPQPQPQPGEPGVPSTNGPDYSLVARPGPVPSQAELTGPKYQYQITDWLFLANDNSGQWCVGQERKPAPFGMTASAMVGTLA